jgi:hypothetical protein
MGDEDDKVLLARLDERVKVLEAKIGSIDTKIWGAVVLILVYVANKFLGLITIGSNLP